jgi:hypothetical protein
MPRLVKGGKWVYGWVVVGRQGEITIPPEAWREFGFQAGEEAVFVPGSRRSGGFAISTPGLTGEVSDRLDGAMLRVLARGRFDAECILRPQQVDVKPGNLYPPLVPIHQAIAHGQHGGLRAIGDAQFAVNGTDVVAHGAL